MQWFSRSSFCICILVKEGAKEQKKFIDNMQKGDKVVTIAGIHGTISKVNEDNTVQLEVSPGSYLKIERSSISLEWSQAINK